MRTGDAPKTLLWSAATPSGAEGQAGAVAGREAGQYAWCQMLGRWESSKVKKREENPNKATGMQACEEEQQTVRAWPKQTAKGAK